MTSSPITITNNPVQIAPGLTLDDTLFTVAAAVIWSYSTFALITGVPVDEAR